ncbi:UNVERIFIED_CONTAM: hypothetical protein Sradi_1764400 [Sesamum radiatum]|uniref:Integrase catalytic domain-containing protein n=1 Tax=Sesamum radiatum TaxID=300843 RepID=A0AAW2TV11_SESRA
MEMPSPTTIKDVQKLTGKIASMNRFLSRSADRSLPFFQVLRNVKNFSWTEECEKAFQDLKMKVTVLVLQEPSQEKNQGSTVVDLVEQDLGWKKEIVEYLTKGTTDKQGVEKHGLIKRVCRFTMVNGELYKRTFEGLLLKCLDQEGARYVLKKIHEGCCGNHAEGRSLAQKVMRQWYYWPTLLKDVIDHVRRCIQCQIHANLIHQPATNMEVIKLTYPFDQLGIDLVRPLLLAKGQRKFIIVAIEYFSKWVEAEALSKITENEVMNFIWKNIVCRFGVLRILAHFQGKKKMNWCKEMSIQQNFTSVGNPHANGQTEVMNQTILQNLKTRLDGAQGKLG